MKKIYNTVIFAEAKLGEKIKIAFQRKKKQEKH